MTRSPTDDRVETPKQLAERVGISEYHIRKLIRTDELEHVQIGGGKFIPSGAWPRYVEANKRGGASWQDETKGQSYDGLLIAEILVTDILTIYAREHGPKVVAPRAIGSAIEPLTSFWAGRSVADVTLYTCERYGTARQRSVSTVRRELAVLGAAINWAFKSGRITRTVSVTKPLKPDPKERWLTRREAACVIRATKTDKARFYLPRPPLRARDRTEYPHK